jgi:hypothetical protein
MSETKFHTHKTVDTKEQNHWTDWGYSRCLPPLTWWRKQIQFPKRCVL